MSSTTGLEQVFACDQIRPNGEKLELLTKIVDSETSATLSCSVYIEFL